MITLEHLQQGGVAMYFIIAASIVGVAYTIYCLLILRRGVVLSRPLMKLAESDLSSDVITSAQDVCRKEGGPFAEVLLTVFATSQASREEAETLVESAGRRAAHELSRGILVLEVVAAISPLMGLLGTVIGMYRVFEKISQAGAQEVMHLSEGISQALITTIAGLSVAIPAYIVHTYFSRRVDDLVLEMERQAITVMTRLRNR